MAQDDKSKQGRQDDQKIAADEYPYWMNKWGVSREVLRNAIKETASHAVSIIEQYLKDTGEIGEASNDE